jgi:hypothetical protein
MFVKGCGSALKSFSTIKNVSRKPLSTLYIYYTLFNFNNQERIYYSQTAIAVLVLLSNYYTALRVIVQVRIYDP